MSGPRILLVVGGGIAAYKSCELVRAIRKGGGDVTCVLTDAGQQFVTPMALAALSENPVHTTLWDLKNEVEMGHIQLSREADLVVVCPATANLLAKMAAGIADDLATTLLLATDKPVMAVPAMNVRMWQHEATRRNVDALRAAGVDIMDPDEGAMACGEYGPGRLPDPAAIWHRIAWALGADTQTQAPSLAAPDDGVIYDADPGDLGGLTGSLIARGLKRAKQAISFGHSASESVDEDAPDAGHEGPILPRKGEARAAPPEPLAGDEAAFPAVAAPDDQQGHDGADTGPRPLEGVHVLVTAGPTWEPIDPVRYIANRSSGRQGFAIAAAAAAAGARVTLVAGPVALATPRGVDRVDVESALEMAEAVKSALPADIGVMVAAVADWRPLSIANEKIKKRQSAPPALLLTENPDILASVATMNERPRLLIGFAAETDNVIKYAKDKRKRKGVDWIIANDVSGDVMGGAANAVHIITGDGVESLPEMPKEDVARILVERMADALAAR